MRSGTHRFGPTRQLHRSIQGQQHPGRQEIAAAGPGPGKAQQGGSSGGHGIAAVEPDADASPAHLSPPQSQPGQQAGQLAGPRRGEQHQIVGPLQADGNPQRDQLGGQGHRHREGG